MPPKEKQRIRYWWLVALGLTPVLLFAWFREDLLVEEDTAPSFDGWMEDVEDAWPTPPLPDGMGDFVTEAMGLSCASEDACHLLWADKAEPEWAGQPYTEKVALVAHVDDDGGFAQTWAEWSDRDGPGETAVGETFPLDPDAAVLPVSPIGSASDKVWLFPEGAEEIGEIRHSEADGLVEEDLERIEGDHFDRVRTVPGDQWWARAMPAGVTPLIRYRLGSETVYSVGGEARVCVDEPRRSCHTTFPSEEALVSLRTMWDHQNDFSWGGDDRFELDESVDIGPDLHGVLDAPVGEGAGHAARIRWEGPHTEDEAPQTLLETYAVYFDDGTPALLSALRRPEAESLPAPEEAEVPEGITGIALFPHPDESGTAGSGSTAWIPIALHPSGEQHLVAPALAEAGGDSGHTVYDPLDDDLPVAYTSLNEEGRPLESGWLSDGEVRP
ncbi:hypothetical protein [Nocardiopsis oceani]